MNYDFKLTDDGDLIFGQQKTDADGRFLYYQDAFGNNEELFETTEPGDNIPIRDLEHAYGDDARIQLLKTRVQTDSPDFKNYPQVGANLSDLIGMPNNQETAEQGIAMIRETLTYDGLFNGQDLTIRAIPVSDDTLLFDIKLKRNNEIWRYAITFNVDIGILNHYEMRQ